MLAATIHRQASFLCVGLDPDPARLPPHLLQGEEDPLLAFNRQIIEATLPYAVAYKPNLAFYEARGMAGWQALEQTLALIPPDRMIIADAKRGDIGNTSRLYAQALFEGLGADAATVAPYMGEDSVSPFLEMAGKWTLVLALTSNPGAQDFQYAGAQAGEPLYASVIWKSQAWAAGKPGLLGFVVGATRAETLSEIRRMAPQELILAPGVGEQGGDLEQVCRLGRNEWGGLLVNVGRSILYAGSGRDFAEKAGQKAASIAREMRKFIPDM
jgi:orotidine-5'-phosphate decarboxylase